ncbi:uncharacterized protein LOC131857685 [Cryptomeria japonica]|uniref:uncharacterized protein LOC131857685 n=1 Tax=Cryptomeria japonica TaxID=3369 RepID=UPI0027DA1FFD|nr:uncharacterized protein LOC131857685 [Cryptomeria japonica]
MNKNYAAKVNEEIERILEADIIFRVETSEWVSPIVISLKEANQIRTTYKMTTDQTSFQLMYRQEAVVPAEFMVPSLRIAIENRLGDMESLRERLYVLNKLDEKRMMAQWATEAAQQRRKLWHDKHLKRMKFALGQLVLKYNGRNEIKPGKFKVR